MQQYYMTQHIKNFNWDKDTRKVDYVKAFEGLKEAIQAAMALHFPDYELEWIMRTDASDG